MGLCADCVTYKVCISVMNCEGLDRRCQRIIAGRYSIVIFYLWFWSLSNTFQFIYHASCNLQYLDSYNLDKMDCARAISLKM